jgi:hypothetical protein
VFGGAPARNQIPEFGKTALVDAVLEHAAVAGALVARGACVEQYGSGEASLLKKLPPRSGTQGTRRRCGCPRGIDALEPRCLETTSSPTVHCREIEVRDCVCTSRTMRDMPPRATAAPIITDQAECVAWK